MIEEERFCVYIHELPDGRKYVGMTMQNPETRFNHGNGYRNNDAFYSEIDKIGWNNIKHVIVAENLAFQEAAQLEIELIREFDTTNPEHGFNYVGGNREKKQKYTVNPLNLDFAYNLVKLRKSAKISQEILAKRVGVTQALISQYEKGFTRPKYDIATSIASVLGTTYEKLIGGGIREAE